MMMTMTMMTMMRPRTRTTTRRNGQTNVTTETNARARGRGRGRAREANASEDAIAELRELARGTWRVNEYKSKRIEHVTTKGGEILGEDERFENIAEHPGWGDEGKLRFCVATASEELGIDVEECGRRLARVFTLVPGIERRVLDREVKMADVVRMAANVPDVAMAFVRLKDILPESDLAKMIESKPSLLLEDPNVMARKVGELRAKCPRLRWDLILSDFTQLWDIEFPATNVELLQEKLNLSDDEVQTFISQRPEMLLSVQSRHEMIPYDNGTLAQVQATMAGDKFSDGW